MWEISEGDTKFLYTMRIVPPKDLGSILALFIASLFTESTGTWHYSLTSKIHIIKFINIQTPANTDHGSFEHEKKAILTNV